MFRPNLGLCAKLPGFTPELLKIACDNTLAGPVRQASVIYFKNTVSKYWEANNEDSIPEERRDSYVIPDADKEVLKANILEAICISQDSIRPQLCVACQLMIRTDFPDKWNGLLPELEKKLLSSEPAYLLGALLTVYRMSKVYEYKRAQERSPLVHVMKAVLPVLYQHLVQLMPNQSEQAVTIQKLMFKIFYALIQFNLNLDMVPIPSLDAWIEACKEVLVRPVPDEVNSIEDEEERAYTVWWKCKKWAAKIIERIYERYSTPGHKEEGYAEFGNHFVQKFSVPFCEVMMKILDEKRNGVYVTDRVTLLALGFLNTSISHSYTWKVLKPHAQEIVTTVLFPLLCHSDSDEAMWEEDVEEYIRFKYDIFEDIHNPVYGAGSLLGSFARRKDVLHPILAFTIQILSSSTNPREVDGALRMIGELSEQICKNKKYKKDVEKLLDSHVINRLSEPCRFIRARAAWCLKQYSPAIFTAKTLSKAIESLVNCLCNSAEEIPAKVEAAIALESFLDDQDGSARVIQPHVSRIIPNVLELCSKTQIEDVVSVMDKFMEEFMEDIVPIARSVADQMCKLFLEIIKSDVADERTPALMSIMNSLSNVVDIVGEHPEIMVRIEESLLEVITYVFETSNIDFYDEVLIVIQSLISFTVSEPMWQVFDKLMEAYTANLGVLQFSDVIPVFHLYITTNTESFLARPERLNAVINLSKSVLQNKEEGDENQLYAAKILEIILLQCNTMINEVIPSIMLIALERLGQPFEDGLTELKHMVLLVVVAAVYVNSELAFSALKELAPGHPNPFDFICNQLVEMVDQFSGIHNRKMALFAWCTMMQLPPNFRPSIFSFDSKTVLLCSIKLFNGLQRALKVQAENRKLGNEEDSDDSDIDSDDEGHRNIDDDLSDDDDQYDELTLDYLRNLSKENKGDDDDDDETDFDDDETESEQYTCCMDRENGPDVFITFKNCLEGFKVKDEVLFLQMVNNLSEEQQQELLALDKVCENHVKAEQSKLVRQRGGYSFNAEAEVPGNFNFGN
ncbi:unnamed protein product [Auanema sp. JU1783]|nr:unnamed protein product [Auanema sp. JU1783]